MSEKLISSTEKKYGKKTKLAAGLLAATGLIGGLAACSDNSEAQPASNASVINTAESNRTEDISKYTVGNSYIRNFDELKKFTQESDLTNFYGIGDIKDPDDPTDTAFVSWVDLGFLTKNREGLAAAYVNGGPKAIIDDISTKDINYDEMEALEKYTAMAQKSMQRDTLIPQTGLSNMYRNLEADNTVAKIMLDNPEFTSKAKIEGGHGSLAQPTRFKEDDTYGYNLGVDKTIELNCGEADPIGILDKKIFPNGTTTNVGTINENLVAANEQLINLVAVLQSKKPNSSFNKTNATDGTVCQSKFIDWILQ